MSYKNGRGMTFPDFCHVPAHLFSCRFATVKKVASIGLVLMMSLQCFYQLGVITYFQLNQEFIAEVLCINKEKPAMKCHGQCFLKAKLNMGDDTQSDKETLPPTQRVELPVFLISENSYSFEVPTLLEGNNSRYLPATSSAHDRTPFHPPLVVS